MRVYGVFKFAKNLQKPVALTLVLVFGLSYVLNLFTNRNNDIAFGEFKFKVKDLVSLGGGASDQAYARAVQTLSVLAILQKQAEILALSVPDQLIKEYVQEMFTVNDHFDSKQMKSYMASNGISDDGLFKLAKLAILTKHFFAIVEKGMPPQEAKAKAFIKGIETKRDVYVLQVDMDSISPENYVQPNRADLAIVLAGSGINGECEMINIGHSEVSEVDYNKLPVKMIAVQDGQIQIDDKPLVSALTIDPDSYTSQPYLMTNGSRAVFKFKNLFGIEANAAKDIWRKSRKAKERAAEKLLSETLNMPNIDDTVKASKGLITMQLVEGLNLAEAFQNQCVRCVGTKKCPQCALNDCVCNKCFNAKSKFKITREAAILGLFAAKTGIYAPKGIGVRVKSSYAPSPSNDQIEYVSDLIRSRLIGLCKDVALQSAYTAYTIRI